MHQIIQQKLILDNIQIVLSDGFKNLLDTYNTALLHKLYGYLDDVKALDYLIKTWNFIIKEKGIQIIKQSELHESHVFEIIDLKQSLEKVVINSFRSST